MTNHESKIQALKLRRAELLREVSNIEQTLDAQPSKDWEDRAVERQGDEVLESLGSHDLDELRRIDAALARGEDGSFGICTQCGNQISEERLATVPETPFCKDCARVVSG